MFQLRSNEGRLEEFSTFTEAYKRFDEGYVNAEDGSDNPDIWIKLSWTIESVNGNTTRLVLYDDGTYTVLSPLTVGNIEDEELLNGA